MWDSFLSSLVCLQDDKADVILKYMPDEARLLKAYGELPENTRLNEGIAGGLDEEDDGPGDDYIEFEDEDLDKLQQVVVRLVKNHLLQPHLVHCIFVSLQWESNFY